MNNNELKIMVPGCRVVHTKVMPDGSCVLMLKPSEDNVCSLQENILKLVPASELSLSDDFLNYTPLTEEEECFMEEVKKVIRDGVSDFWRPIIDPSFDIDGNICYEYGRKPAVGMAYEWWRKHAKEVCPERNSRLGTKSEYVAFLAVLIKELYASGWALERAWGAVCNDSKELGHYKNSSFFECACEATCSREVLGWFDLANIGKFLTDDKEENIFWWGAGSYAEASEDSPLAFIMDCEYSYDGINCCTGWLVFN